MKKSGKRADIIILIVLALIIAAIVVLLIIPGEDKSGPEKDITQLTVSDYADKNIGVITGTLFETFVKEHYPDAEISYFNNASDLVAAVKVGKIDTFLTSIESASMLEEEDNEVTHIRESAGTFEAGVVFPKTDKGEKLRSQMDEFIKGIEADGTLDRIKDFWRSDEGKSTFVDTSGLTGENGTLHFATCGDEMPGSFLVNGKPAGHNPDLAVRFCKKYGYGIDIVITDFSGVIPGLLTGIYDFAGNDVVITEERKESVYFSTPYLKSPVVMIVKNTGATASGGYNSIDELSDKRIGVMTGSIYEGLLEKQMPDVQISFFDKAADMAIAVTENMIDAFVCSDVQANSLVSEVKGIKILGGFPERAYSAFAFPKTERGAKLRDEMNEFLAKIRADGTFDAITEKWKEGGRKTVEIVSDGTKGAIKMVTTGTTEPYTYMSDGKLVGLDIDLAARFSREYGYDLDISVMEFGSIIPGLASGMYDFAGANITVTDERAESVYFSDSYTSNELAFIVKEVSAADTPESEKTGFFAEIAESFEKNFIREDRWKLIVEGILTTLLITVSAVVFGSLLAFGICMLRRTEGRIAVAVTRIYVKLLQGTPMVVLLMILYYIVFGKSGIEAVWVTIIGFSMNFGAYASEIMRSGIESIDGGQREAALALGFSESQTFFRFIFPQAAARIMPVYNQEIVSLLKNTSIVGYIAIQDLTKMSDIIRSRTYEAFFPLIVTAVIYFILAWILVLLLKLVAKRITPGRKRR